MSEAEQRISDPAPEDLAQLARQRAFIEGYLGDEPSRQKYLTAAGKLGLLRALLEAHAFQITQTWELQCMGVVLGDAFVQELGLRWVIVEDQYGRVSRPVRPGEDDAALTRSR